MFVMLKYSYPKIWLISLNALDTQSKILLVSLDVLTYFIKIILIIYI
jgi:hypothetical protein